MESMCNAIQQRMVEEALVEKEVYEAMMTMRNRINETLGMPVPNREETDRNSRPRFSSNGGQRGGSQHSREWEYVYGDGTIPEPKKYDSPVGTEVAAIGDMERDPNRPIAPYIPPTDPQNDTNPFPMLNGPMG